MKNIIKTTLILITILIFSNCKSQTSLPQDGDNLLNDNINKFIGTWNWSSGGSSLQLVFKKENILLPVGNNVRTDILYGFHKYIQNNINIEDSTQFINTSYQDKKSTFFAIGAENFPNKLKGTMTYISKNKSVNLEFEFIDATHIRLVSIKNLDGIRINVAGKSAFDWSISLPQNITLTKQ